MKKSKSKKFSLIVIILLLILGLSLFYLLALRISRKRSVDKIYRERYTVEFMDNKSPGISKIPGFSVELEQTKLMPGEPFSREWLIFIKTNEFSDITGMEQEIRYLVYLRYSINILDSKPQIIRTTILEPGKSNQEVIEDVESESLLFLYEDYFYRIEKVGERKRRGEALLETYAAPKLEFGNDQIKIGKAIYITSTQGTQLLYGDGRGNDSYIDLFQYIPDTLNKSYLLNLEGENVLVCGTTRKDKKFCYVISIPDFKLVKKYDVTDKWGYIFLSPLSDGIFIIRTNYDEEGKEQYPGELLFLDFNNKQKEYKILRTRPRVFFDKDTKILKLMDLYLTETQIEINLEKL